MLGHPEALEYLQQYLTNYEKLLKNGHTTLAFYFRKDRKNRGPIVSPAPAVPDVKSLREERLLANTGIDNSFYE